ncbi:MAG: MoaD/ThiS family protein [Chloroflexota bacterium]|tara:strand:+ start:505 stop:768 length:264 start_codon:yes stop_codon:yes gene_type:complete
MIKVFLPYKIREILDVPVEIEAEGTNLRGLIDYLENMYPGVKNQLVEDDKLRPGMSAVIDGRTTRLGLIQKLENVSEIHFLPAIAGG